MLTIPIWALVAIGVGSFLAGGMLVLHILGELVAP